MAKNGLSLDDITARLGKSASVQRSYDDDNPQGKFGRHEYKLAEFGLTVDRARASFADYLAAYDVEPEG